MILHTFATISKDAVRFSVIVRGIIEPEYHYVKTIDELEKFMDIMIDVPMMCSSSLDWPCDYTSDPEVIKIACLLRGNDYEGIMNEMNLKTEAKRIWKLYTNDAHVKQQVDKVGLNDFYQTLLYEAGTVYADGSDDYIEIVEHLEYLAP